MGVLIKCPSCGKSRSEARKKLDSDAERVADVVEGRVWARIWWLLGGTGVAAIASLYFLYTLAIGYIDSAIEHQFAKPQVRKTMLEVASAKSEELLRSTINPAIEDTQRFINEQKLALRTEVDAIKVGFQSELDVLRDQADLWQAFEEIQLLQDRSVAGEFEAFERLEKYATDDERLRRRADSSVLAVKTTYIGNSRKGAELKLVSGEGEVVLEKDLSTRQLLSLMQVVAVVRPWTSGEFRVERTSWDRRARAAFALRDTRHRNCREVPGALLTVAQRDPSLWVRREALVAFVDNMRSVEAVVVDAFGWEQAAAWWEENGEEQLESREYSPCVAPVSPPGEQRSEETPSS